MTAQLVATSHTPLIGRNDDRPEVRAEVDKVLDRAREFVRDFDPEVVVIYGPDHFNGFHYDLMPGYCIGLAANSVGDYGLPSGRLDVDRETALLVLEHTLHRGIDIAVSEDMKVDHGIVQPLTFLFEAIDAVPVVPIFINCVAEPLGPARRAVVLGTAVGQALRALDRRVLIVGSGGLSHDPPIPRLEGATPAVAQVLIHGSSPSASQRAARERRVVEAAKEFVAGSSQYRPLNPAWDRFVLRSLQNRDLSSISEQSNDWFVQEGGHSAHEVRTWLAAYATLAQFGEYHVTSTYYRPIPEWLDGFATTTAVSIGSTWTTL